MALEKSHYSLAEAADFAKCKSSDLLHYAVQNRRFALLIGVPDWVEVRAYDEATNTDIEPFLMVPQLLVLRQSYCLKIEINGRTQQSDFPTGYFVESSGKLKKIRPSYGYRALNPDFLCWRTYRDKLVTLLELVPENLFVMHADLAQFLEPAVKPEADTPTATSSKPRKSKRPDLTDASPQSDSAEISVNETGPTISTADSNKPDTRQPDKVDEKYQTDQRTERSDQAPKGRVLLRIKQVQAATKLSRATIYGKLNKKSPNPHFDPTFPKQIQIGTNLVGWVEEEVQAWIESRISASRSKGNKGA